MADRKISQLPVADTPTSADVMPLVQGTTTAKVSLTQLDSRWISNGSQYIALGTNPATTGAIRLPNNQSVQARDSANAANLNLLLLNGIDWVTVGSFTAPYMAHQARDGMQFNLASVTQVTLTVNNLSFKDTFFLNVGTGYGMKIATAATQRLGFFGATPVAQRTGTPAAATDPATTMALVNSLRASLIALGLIS